MQNGPIATPRHKEEYVRITHCWSNHHFTGHSLVRRHFLVEGAGQFAALVLAELALGLIAITTVAGATIVCQFDRRYVCLVNEQNREVLNSAKLLLCKYKNAMLGC